MVPASGGMAPDGRPGDTTLDRAALGHLAVRLVGETRSAAGASAANRADQVRYLPLRLMRTRLPTGTRS